MKYNKNYFSSYLNKNQDTIVLTLTSTFSIILSIIANGLYEKIKLYCQNIPSFVIIIIFIILDLIAIYKLSQIVMFFKKILFPYLYENNYIQQAFISMKTLANKQGEVMQTALESGENHISIRQLIEISTNNIKNVVEQCFEFFDNAFSSKQELIKTINFEVTFMTLSYKDNMITIPAASNRENTLPHSMLKREENPTIYNETVTAEIYKEYNLGLQPQMCITENTETGYKFIYEGQGKRIKSSIVLPIISHRNELLGTLVVHCDCANFFMKKKEKFWKEILGIFAVEISKEKVYLDMLVKQDEKNKPF